MGWNSFCNLYKVQERFQDVDINNCTLIDPEIIAVGKKWLENPYKSLIITGEPGLGKTHFSYALLREVIKTYRIENIRWIKSKNFDDKLTEASKSGMPEESKYIMETFTDIMFLFLDDFGIERSTERTERDYYELIDERWANKKITVITTNLDAEQIRKNFGVRVFSRLKDYTWIQFGGDDLRGTGI